ncbi:MAG: Rpn family recombination-promoting nuclease/putative transposase [Leptospirales bacterium]|nr:Rpn family recombination-promoting nuclease/putative transposase [Leptospirales bacterium]
MAINKKYKDSVFRSIFNNKSSLLELYNAIHDTNHQDESIIEINTLKDALFSARKNDISFTVNKKMVVLIEHQSTINENMPLRILSYIVRIYEKTIDERIFRESLGKIPRPEFIVLYNGKAPLPKEKYLRLSDAFEKTDNGDLISLDLIVRMLNINKGHNLGLECKSKTLSGYADFVAKIREYEKKYAKQNVSMPRRDRMSQKTSPPLEKAVKSAVKYCVKNGILADYFKQNTSEEVSMNFIKYDEKIAIKVAREEAMEKGMEKGIEKGMEKGRTEGKKEGQKYVLKLMAQGLSYEEIKKKVEKPSKKNHR